MTTLGSGETLLGDPLMVMSPCSLEPSVRMPSAPAFSQQVGAVDAELLPGLARGLRGVLRLLATAAAASCICGGIGSGHGRTVRIPDGGGRPQEQPAPLTCGA